MKGRYLWLQRKRRLRQATAAVVVREGSRTLAAEEINKAAAKRPAAVIEQKVAAARWRPERWTRWLAFWSQTSTSFGTFEKEQLSDVKAYPIRRMERRKPK